jgi:galactokinase/mevalonate kinase-like predicted kinase
MNTRGPLTYNPVLMKELKDQGLTARLVNDDPGRIDHFLEKGWKFVQADGQIGDDKAASANKVGGNLSKHVGSGKTGYLMVRPTEWHEEDQRRKAQAVDDSEKAMKAPPKGTKLKGGEAGEAYGPGLTND